MQQVRLNRRSFLRISATAMAGLLADCSIQKKKHPNIILIMADDQGWGDTGYNGHPHLKTPNLDSMAKNGVQFNRFYAAAPVCSPTRGSCLTGRHPYRYGIYFANTGHLKKQELTLAELLKENGYTTGHFGKWHLGTLTKTVVKANRGGPRGVAFYSPPWENGFDDCFSTESKVPTWDPMVTPAHDSGNIGKRTPGEHFETYYWTGPGKMESENLKGDDSRIIMDRAIPFINKSAKSQSPFFSVIWFHAPHLPVLTGPKHRSIYQNLSVDEQHYYWCITALDEQVGRLLSTLKELDVLDNTMIFYCSDNGPEGKVQSGRTQGTTKGLRGRKRSLYEGGIRVPGILSWPKQIKSPKKVDVPCCTFDYYPTIAASLGLDLTGKVGPLDGTNLWPVINGEQTKRSKPIAFQSHKQLALIDNRFKIISQDSGDSFQLFDILSDPTEKNDIISTEPDIAKSMIKQLKEFQASCRNSNSGADYHEKK
jgi:arylsulfatase A-like enzyme